MSIRPLQVSQEEKAVSGKKSWLINLGFWLGMEGELLQAPTDR